MKNTLLSFAVRLALAFCLLLPITSAAWSVTVVPPGNRNAQQPKIPGGSIKRTRGTTFEKKYQKIRNLLAKDRKLLGKIKRAAQTFGIEPIHIVGALVGEHTYNVDAKDRLQSYYVKALAYLKQDLKFRYKKTSITQLVGQPAFATCKGARQNYGYWSCIESVWNSKYRGKSIAGQRWPNNRLGVVFFQPFYAGQTFGLGQLNPLTALKVNDLVRKRVPREPKLSVRRAPEIYNTIMEPDSTLYYMAAVLRHSIDVYKRIANMDISRNPGVTATLYNLGNVDARAQKLLIKNRNRSKPALPQENYYGWLINAKLADLLALF